MDIIEKELDEKSIEKLKEMAISDPTPPAEPEPEPVKKTKKVRSTAQIAAFEKARKARAEKIAQRKKDKQEVKIQKKEERKRLEQSKTRERNTHLMITFILGGLWHGAGWTFIFWGFLHGFALSIHRIWKNLGFRMNSILAWFITFNFINITWVFFRAKDWDTAIKVLSSMFDFTNIEFSSKYEDKLSFLSEYGITFGSWLSNIDGSKSGTWIFITLLIVFFTKNTIELKDSFKANKKYLVFTLILIIYALSTMNKLSEFLYFNF